MANQLILNSNENPDMADVVDECKVGVPVTMLVTGTPSRNSKGEVAIDVESAEPQEQEEEQEPSSPPSKPMGGMAPGVGKAGKMMM